MDHLSKWLDPVNSATVFNMIKGRDYLLSTIWIIGGGGLDGVVLQLRGQMVSLAENVIEEFINRKKLSREKKRFLLCSLINFQIDETDMGDVKSITFEVHPLDQIPGFDGMTLRAVVENPVDFYIETSSVLYYCKLH
jgi:hypothetical protein